MSTSEESKPRVGLWHTPEVAHAVNTGRQVVVDDFTRNLDRHAHDFRYGLFCPDGSPSPLAEPSPHIDVWPRSAATSPEVEIGAWHDAQFDAALAFAVRAERARHYPITLTHHSVSYVSLLQARVLPMLLHKPRPYDAIVCTSGPARRAVARILGHVAETLRQAHGLDLKYEGQLITIPLGIDTERFQPRDKTKARRDVGIDEDAEVLVWMGRLSAIDKADLMPVVGALAELRKRHPKLRLICCGRQHRGERFGDVLKSYAESRGIGDAVEIRTDVGDELPLLYAAADLFVAPVDNVQETFGLSPVEAMACGVPQVVADWDGYRDTVVHEQTGVLIPTLWADAQADVERGSLTSDPAYDHLALSQSVAVDMAAFVRVVDELLNSPDKRAAMAEASRMRAQMLFGWPSVIAAHELMWKQLSELAAKDTVPLTNVTGLHRFPYASVFRHYPSHWLPNDAPLTITEQGRDLIQRQAGQLPLPLLARFKYLELSVLQRILVGLTKMADKDKTLSLDHIFQVVAKGIEDTPENRARMNRHVMWLIKYGYCKRA